MPTKELPNIAVLADEMLQPHINGDELRRILIEAIDPQLSRRICFVSLRLTSRRVPTKPRLRTISIACTLLDAEQAEIPIAGSWYLTTDSWKGPFVAAFAVHEPSLEDGAPI